MKPVDPLAVLRAFVATHATQRTAATALGISPAYLNDLLHARRDFSETVLTKLGLRQIVVKAAGACVVKNTRIEERESSTGRIRSKTVTTWDLVQDGNLLSEHDTKRAAIKAQCAVTLDGRP